MDVSVDNEVIVNTNGTVEVAVGNAADAVVADDHALDITVTKKEYKIVGDEVYIAKLYDDAPQWMKDLVQLVVDNTMWTESAMLRNDLIGQLNQFATSYVPLNAYTQSIIDLSNANTAMHDTLETLNSNFNDGLNTANSQIIDLQSTKASKDEVATKVIETLTAQLATPTSELGATIGNLQQTIVDGDSANADSVTTLMSVLEGEVDARATAVEYLNTYVGISSSGTSTGTGILASIDVLQKQNDGVIETYTGTYDVILNAAADPELDDELVITAEPYATWKANELIGSLDIRLAHIGDVYIKYETTTTGAKSYIGSYKFIKTVPDGTSPYSTDSDGFTWALIIDQAAQDAYVAALNAWDLADGKRTVFSGSTVPTSAVDGDIWIPGADVNITTSGMCTVAGGTWNGTTCSITKYLKGEIYQYLVSKWTLVTKYSADIASVSSNLQTQLDGKVDTYYQATVPTEMLATNNGDYWYCTADVSTYKKGKVYKYVHATTSWAETADVSRYAFDTADGKASIFTSATLPNVYKINDLLIVHADNAVGTYAAGVVLTATATRTTGSFAVAEWAKKINDTEDLDAFISAIDPKVDTLQNQADGKIEYFFFTTYNQAGTVVAGSANEAAALVKVKAPWATTVAREQANGNVVYFKDSTHGYWYSSATDGWLALTDTSIMQALKKAEDARTVADEKIAAYFALEQSTAPAAPGTVLDTISGKSILVPYYWYDTATSTLKAYSSGWVAVSLSAANNGDQLQAMVVNTVSNTIDYYLYEYNSSATPKWVVRTPTGYVASSTWGVSLATELGSGTTTWAAADSTLENSLHTEIGDEGARVESKFAYNSVLNVGGIYKKSGFGLTSNYSSGSGTVSDPYTSEFWIDATKLKFTNSNVTGGTAPFTIDASGTTPQITFNGKVSFSNVTGAPVYNVTYYQSAAPDPLLVNLYSGDIWYDTNDGNTQYRWNGSIWENVTLVVTASNSILRQTTAPLNPKFKDLWIDSDANNATYWYDGTAWQSVDPDVATAINANTTTISGSKITTGTITTNQIAASTITAANIATDAITADKIKAGEVTASKLAVIGVSTFTNDAGYTKFQTFSQASQPSSAAVGDLWIDTDDNNKTYRYDGSSWIVSSIDAATAINAGTTTISGAKITTGSITADRINTTGLIAENISATTLTGKTITGSTINASTLNLGTLSVTNTAGKATSGVFFADWTIATSVVSSTYTCTLTSSLYTYDSTNVSTNRLKNNTNGKIFFDFPYPTVPSLVSGVMAQQIYFTSGSISDFAVTVYAGSVAFGTKSGTWTQNTWFDIGGIGFMYYYASASDQRVMLRLSNPAITVAGTAADALIKIVIVATLGGASKVSMASGTLCKTFISNL